MRAELEHCHCWMFPNWWKKSILGAPRGQQDTTGQILTTNKLLLYIFFLIGHNLRDTAFRKFDSIGSSGTPKD